MSQEYPSLWFLRSFEPIPRVGGVWIGPILISGWCPHTYAPAASGRRKKIRECPAGRTRNRVHGSDICSRDTIIQGLHWVAEVL